MYALGFWVTLILSQITLVLSHPPNSGAWAPPPSKQTAAAAPLPYPTRIHAVPLLHPSTKCHSSPTRAGSDGSDKPHPQVGSGRSDEPYSGGWIQGDGTPSPHPSVAFGAVAPLPQPQVVDLVWWHDFSIPRAAHGLKSRQIGLGMGLTSPMGIEMGLPVGSWTSKKSLTQAVTICWQLFVNGLTKVGKFKRYL